MRYLVVVDGAGEYDSDFSVLVVEAGTPESAVDRVVGPEMGYGRSSDGMAYVTALESVAVFSINDSSTRTATRTTFDSVVESTSPTLREYVDPDGGHREARLTYEAEQEARRAGRTARSTEILSTPGDPNERIRAERERDAAAG